MRVYAVSSDSVRSLPDARLQQQGGIDGVGLPPFANKKKPSIAQEIHRPAHGKPKTVNAKSPTRASA